MSYLPIASGTRPESGITLREEIQEGSLEEAALKAGLGSEEHRGSEAEWKETGTVRKDEQE